MGLYTRLSNGWTITMNSLSVLKANKQLLIFPILSGGAMLLIIGSFAAVMLGNENLNIFESEELPAGVIYLVMFLYYVVNYFVVVFFNTALIHCTSIYFKGEHPTVRAGINFALSRLGAIFSWALFAGTVGTILKIVQENSGLLGKIITGLIGIVWGVATFFVVPVIAYENMGPVDAVKRSSQLMKEKWGESAGSSFSIGIIQMIAIILLSVPVFLISFYINLVAGVAIGAIALLLIFAISSAVKTIFVSAVYHNIQGDPVQNFDDHFIDNLFLEKKKY